jgi:hypothetical protein
LLFDEIGGCGDGDKTPRVAVDQQHAGADRKVRGIMTGACRHGVPVAEDILETDAARQSLVQRTNGDGRDLANKISIIDAE